MKLWKKRLFWLAFNSLLVFCILGSRHYDSDGLARVGMLLMWGVALFSVLFAFLMLLVIVADKEELVAKSVTQPFPCVPQWLNAIADITIACLCAYYGWVATAIVWLIQWIVFGAAVATIEVWVEEYRRKQPGCPVIERKGG